MTMWITGHNSVDNLGKRAGSSRAADWHYAHYPLPIIIIYSLFNMRFN